MNPLTGTVHVFLTANEPHNSSTMKATIVEQSSIMATDHCSGVPPWELLSSHTRGQLNSVSRSRLGLLLGLSLSLMPVFRSPLEAQPARRIGGASMVTNLLASGGRLVNLGDTGQGMEFTRLRRHASDSHPPFTDIKYLALVRGIPGLISPHRKSKIASRELSSTAKIRRIIA